MKKLLDWIGKHAVIVLTLILLLTVFFAYHAIHISIDADYTLFMPYGEEPEVYIGGNGDSVPVQQIALYDGTESGEMLWTEVLSFPNMTAGGNDIPLESELPDHYGGEYILLFEADDLYTVEMFNTLGRCVKAFVDRPDVAEPFSVFNFVTLTAKGTRLVTTPISTHDLSYTEWTEEEVREVESKIKNDPNLKYYLVSEDSNSIMATFPIRAWGFDSFYHTFDPFMEAGGRVYATGGALINDKVMGYLQKDLATLVSLCFAVILIIFFFSFRSVRSVLVPASLSLIGFIWTIGTMTLLDYQITLLNIVTPCMVLTLGSAYSIHVLNEYYSSCFGPDAITPMQATHRILKTVFVACFTTVCGFLCLTVSETQGLRDFGISVSIGIVYCALLSATYLPALLSLLPSPQPRKLEKHQSSIMNRIVAWLSEFVPRFWYILLIIFVLLFFGFILVKDRISLDSNYMSYFPEDDPFGQESRHFALKMGGTTPFYVTIEAPNGEKNYFLASENLEKVWEYEETVKRESDDILQILSFPSYVSFANRQISGSEGIPENKGLAMTISRLIILMQNQTGGDLSMILDRDATRMTLIVQHWDNEKQDLMSTSSIARVKDVLIKNIDLLPDGTRITIDGDPVVNLKFATRLFSDQEKSSALSVLIVLVIIAITLKSVTQGIYSIIPVLAGVFINYLFMFFAKIPFDVVTVSFTSIAVGCGVDDAIHFCLRYRNIRKEKPELSVSSAITATIRQTGYPIIITTVSIVFGMMMLSFASYTPIRYFGLLMSITLFGCMVSTILFLPSFMILGDRIKNHFRK